MIFIISINAYSLYYCKGCRLNKLIDWNWVCRTNTLGWEQCDVLANEKRKRDHLEFPGDDRAPKR